MKLIELALGYRNDKWYCSNSQIYCEANELHELDKLLIKILSPIYPGIEIEIKYLFDFDSFPLWMRQYMPHYFNRKFILKLKQNTDYESNK